jgi:putative phosphoribosyl transferase
MTYRFDDVIQIPVNHEELTGELIMPGKATSLVIFSHGSGSSRFSSRNIFVAEELQRKNIGTFLFDLLTRQEDEQYENRFNIELLTERLIHVTKYISTHPKLSDLKLGYFGASTGAASALKAAAALPDLIHSVVSRGGRPDLAMDVIARVEAPTLFIVGERDYDVLELNKKAYMRMKCEKDIKVVQDATHLFEEPGALHEVAGLASTWFKKYLNSNNHKNDYKNLLAKH